MAALTFHQSGPQIPSAAEKVAREALVNYIKTVALDEKNPEGCLIRRAVLDHRSKQARREAEREMLAQAEAFPRIINPKNQFEPWTIEENNNLENGFYYFGRILGLAVEIELDQNGERVKRVFIEAD